MREVQLGPGETINVGLRRLRLLAAAALVMHAVTGRSPDLFGVPAAVVAIAMAALLVATNLLSLTRQRSTIATLRTLDLAELTADTAATIAVVTGLGAVDESLAWALLVVPVLEGALRYRLVGAVITWAVVAVCYLTIELWGLTALASEQAAFVARLQALVPRVGLVLLLAVPGGYLADQLVRAIAAQRRAKFDASTRGLLLERVVTAGRSITALGGSLERDVVDCAVALGFSGADLCERDGRSGRWVVGWPSEPMLPDPDSAAGGAHFAVRRKATVIVESNGDDPEVDEALAVLGWSAVIAVPVRDGDIDAVLRVGLRPDDELSVHQIECLELLAGHVSVALRNTGLIRELRHAQDLLEHQAFHDALTKLPNREYFFRQLDHVLTEQRHAAGSVLFLDLDRFKEVNDGLGHDIGDELLTAVARRLTHVLRDDSLVARLGGDEFTVLLRDAATPADAETVADRICDALREPFRLAGHEVVASCSIGIAMVDGTAATATELLRRADVAMYQAKSRGAASWRVWTVDMDGAALERMRLDTELRGAFERGELGVAYQPIADAATGRILGVEALLRWPSQSAVRPDTFIPLAEDTGFIVELGQWVLAESCAQLSRWRAEFPDLALSMSVNVSPRELMRPGFVEALRGILEESGAPVDGLILEMTERVFAGDDAPSLVAAVRDLGVRVAIDDFGQGQASMSYLTRFKVDVLKIDKAFVRRNPGRDTNGAIVRSIIALAHDLGIKVVAEGVETGAQVRRLRKIECDAIQGFYFSAPLNRDDLDRLLEAESALAGVTPTARRARRAG